MANCFAYFRVLIQLLAIELHLNFGFAAKTHLTLLNIGSAFANRGTYQCYQSETGTVITFGKAFRISTSDSLVEQRGVNQRAYAGARTLSIPYDGNFFGVYYCKGVINGETTIVNTTIVDQDASNSVVKPTNEKTTITASVGEAVTVSFEVTTSGDRIWRKDGVLLDDYQNMYAQTSLVFNSVQVADAGMYELYVGESSRTQYRHSFIELIVRGCEAGRWGAPRCTGICHNCYNGGVCDDETGDCICAPGFRGSNCDTTCGGNRFGINCEIKCTKASADPADACKGHHYCLTKPFGCDCITGYSGLTCSTDCGSGTFGAGCRQQCHCASGGCNQYTGECSSGSCASGWSGSNCQVPSICPVGYYATFCTLICHCFGNVECDRITGACTNNKGCAKGYSTYDGTPVCQTCVAGTYGDNCALTCNCDTSSCHHETGCDGGCYSNWLPDSCTTGIIATSNVQVNPYQNSTFTCDIEGDVTGVTIMMYIGTSYDEPVDETGRTKSNGITKVSFFTEAVQDHYYKFEITEGSQKVNRYQTAVLYNLPSYIGTPSESLVTGSSVDLTWREWSTSEGDSGDGPIVGYVVFYRPFSSDWSEILQVDQPRATVPGLDWEERYYFSVAAVREGPGGEGPRGDGFADVTTSCGVPSAPNVTTYMSPDTPKQIQISWELLTTIESKCSAGVEAYKVSYRRVDEDEVVTNTGPASSTYIINNLEVFTKYTITVTAENKDVLGSPRVIHEYSPEEKSPAPDVTAKHGGSYLKVFVSVSDSYGRNLYGNIISYEVRYKSGGDKWENKTINEDQGREGYEITNVQETGYEVSARVVNGAGPGNWSSSAIVARSTDPGGPGTDSAVIGAVIGILLLLCIIVILAVFIRRRQRYPKHNDTVMHRNQESSFSAKTTPDYSNKYQSTEYLSSAVEKPKDEITTPELERKAGRISIIPKLPDDFDEEMYQNVETLRPINIKDLPDFVAKKRLNPLDGLQHEYGKLQKGQSHPWEVAARSANRTKNRFKNIVAYDHSRVVLEEYDDDPESGYINACYISGYYKQGNAYIASQGPNSASLIDFWRMIWQENVSTIVMLTNIIESGKEKCKKYWPDNRGHVAEYGEVSLLLEVTENYADYKIRSFKVWKGDDVDFRRIKQFHFTSWPDMGVPLYATAALNFIKKIKYDAINTSAPMLVHCSAGVGRTGTFIGIEGMMDMIDKENKVDVYNFVRSIRDQRINMVQTPEQYVFIYDALLEYSLCGDTSMNTSNFQTKLSKLKRLIPQTKTTYLEEEYEILQHVTPHPSADYCKAGHLPENVKKNRVSNIVPIDRNRPFLVTESFTGGNEYINASFVDGYKQKDKFIATQMPLPDTVGDMWRLLCDWNVRSVVMLNDMDPTDASCAQYWVDKDGGSDQFGPLTVTLKTTLKKGDVTVREFSIHNKKKSGPEATCTVHMYQVHGWPANQDVPENPTTLLEVLELVDNNQHDYHHGNHPIAVHCMNGIGRTGIYCTVVEVVERMKLENVIDIFQTIKKLRTNRPGLVQNIDQYIFCYDIISNYLGCFETYANLDS